MTNTRWPHIADDERGFGFVRVITGDEMSKRVKFALITWMGHEVSPLKRAKMSTDKSLVKSVINVCTTICHISPCMLNIAMFL